jgi:hypothetical protein
VSHLEFWQRYLFRKALLEDEEARREAMERRAEKERQTAENFQWDQGKDKGKVRPTTGHEGPYGE